MKKLVLVRRDDSTYRVELLRWQIWDAGIFGSTQSMIENHRQPALFPNSVWEIAGDEFEESNESTILLCEQ